MTAGLRTLSVGTIETLISSQPQRFAKAVAELVDEFCDF
jgi:hypothetical protein